MAAVFWGFSRGFSGCFSGGVPQKLIHYFKKINFKDVPELPTIKSVGATRSFLRTRWKGQGCSRYLIEEGFLTEKYQKLRTSSSNPLPKISDLFVLFIFIWETPFCTPLSYLSTPPPGLAIHKMFTTFQLKFILGQKWGGGEGWVALPLALLSRSGLGLGWHVPSGITYIFPVVCWKFVFVHLQSCDTAAAASPPSSQQGV